MPKKAVIDKMAHVLDAVIQLRDNFSSTIQTVEKNVGSFSRTAKKMGRDIQRVGKDLQSFGKTMTTHVTLPIVGAGTVAVKSFIDMEDAFSGVKKTIQGTPEQLQEVKKALDDMATVKGLPIARKELYGIAETAGQLGVERENIEGFTETIAKVGRITNLSYEQGSASLARFSNVMGMSMDDMDRLGSTIVHLDTNLATSASEIVDMGMRLAAAGKQANMSEADVLGLAGALSSVGLESQAGGSAFSKVIQGINDSVFSGGKELQKFAKVAGMSSKEFSTLFKQDASQAIATFIQGLGRVKEEGYNVSAVIEDLGFSEYRTRDALLRATEAGDLFVDSLSKANTAWAENTALNDVFATRTDNVKAQLEVLRNKFGLLAEQFGEIIIPHVVKVVDKLGDLMDRFSALDDTQKENIVRIAGMAAAIGPVIGVIGKMTNGVGRLIVEFGFFAGRIKNLGLIGAIFTPGVKVVLIIGAIIAAVILLYKNFDKIKTKVNEVFPNAQQTISTSIEHIKNIFWGLSRVLSIVMLPVQLAFFTAWEIIKNVFVVAVETIGGVISGLLQALSGIIDFVVNVFTGNWAGAWQAVQDIFGGIFKGLVALAKAPLNLIIGLVNGVIGGLNKIKLPKWVPKIGGKGINIPLIPKLAKGTSNWQGGIVQVHEKGGEIIDLPRGSRVYPHDESVTMAKEQGRRESKGILITGNTFNVREEADIDKIADALARKIEKASLNMA